MNGATKPVTVKLEEAVETELPAEGQERDSEFGKFVQKTLGRDLFSSIQITGDWIFTGLGRAVCKVTLLSEKKGFLWK